MIRVSGASVMAFSAVMASMFSLGMSLTTAACSTRTESRADATKPVPAVTSVGAAVAARSEQQLTAVVPASTVVAPAVLSSTTPGKAQPAVIKSETGNVIVKRFVVTTGVHEREPEALAGALRADGKPIFAFAEVQNRDGTPTNVRVTFQRKGSPEQVGNVTLAVPAQTQRYRTWGTTRFVRESGGWEAILWSEDGKELARVGFEVEAA